MCASARSRFRQVPRALAWVLAIGLVAGDARAEAVHVVLVPSLAGGPVSCKLWNTRGTLLAGRLAAPRSGEWQWSRLPGDILLCAGRDLEPLEVDPERTPIGPELVLSPLPARAIAFEAGWDGLDTRIEWRALEGGTSPLLARQRATIADRLMLPVARAPRLLRFAPKGHSPLSVVVSDTRAQPLRLPPPSAGGELLGIWPPGSYRPETLELRAADQHLALALEASGLFERSGLTPGPYSLVASFRGGVVRKLLDVTIQAGESAELLPLVLPGMGAATIVALPEVCADAELPARLQVVQLANDALPRAAGPRPRADGPARAGPAGSPKLVHEETIAAAPCARPLEGLEVGLYEATLARGARPPRRLSSSRFEVRQGETTDVTLVAAVRVTGHVKYDDDDSPAAGLAVAFELEGRRWSARADERGGYAALLGEPGEYRVSLQASRGLPSLEAARFYHAGEQVEDFTLRRTAIEVRFARADGLPIREGVEVALLSKEGRRNAGQCLPEQERLVRFMGVEYGPYRVTASTPSGLASDSASEIVLTPEQPAVQVELVLRRQGGALEVVDEDGAPVTSARVLLRDASLPERAPGVFSLEGLPAGERLSISAEGFSPSCRVLRPEDLPDLRVTLSKGGERLALQFPAHVPWETGLLQGLPGSDCPIGIRELGAVPRLEPETTTVELSLPRGQYRFALGALSIPVSAPGRFLVGDSTPGSQAQ